MEKHISKKFFAGILALSAGFVLASCDPVTAVPTNYKDPLVVNNDGSKVDLDDNILGTIYDSVTSDKNAKIVSDILEDIALKKFGSYNEFVKAKENDSERDKFMANYPEFFEGKVARFNDFKEDIDARISEYFYNEITSGSYNDDLGKFNELKLYNAHRYELYDLEPSEAELTAIEKNNFFVTKELTKENAFEKLTGNVYRNAAEGKRGYIEEKVYPDILKNKLVEDYVYTNNPSSLGRAYARKVSYVKVAYEDQLADTWKLMKNFATDYILDAAVTDEEIEFEVLDGVVKGFTKFDYMVSDKEYLVDNAAADTTSKAYKLLSSVYGDIDQDATALEKWAVKVAAGDAEHYAYNGMTLIPAGSYYKDTKLGEIIVSYQKAIKAEQDGRFPTDADKAELDKFTSDGKSKEYGLMKKLIALAKEDYTTDGWFVKNGGLTELPSVIRDRLFNIKVANSLDDATALPAETTIGEYNKKNYLRNINGKKVVLPSDASPVSEEPFNYIYHDVDGKAFYICQVLEAPSTAKLNASSTSAYAADKIETVSRQVAKILGTKDSYIKDAYTEYLNKYEFTFNDTSLYEYLKSEYPDLDQFSEDK